MLYNIGKLLCVTISIIMMPIFIQLFLVASLNIFSWFYPINKMVSPYIFIYCCLQDTYVNSKFGNTFRDFVRNTKNMNVTKDLTKMTSHRNSVFTDTNILRNNHLIYLLDYGPVSSESRISEGVNYVRILRTFGPNFHQHT